MNKAFRIIWSHVRNAFVVVDELASTAGKRSGARLLLASAVSLLAATGSTSALAVPVCQATISGPLSGTQFVCADGLTVQTGTVASGGWVAVEATDNFTTIDNAGSLEGFSIGILLSAIEGDNLRSGVSLINQDGGRISGGSSGVYFATDIDRISLGSFSNAGDIEGGTTAIYGSNLDIVGNLVNSGSIRQIDGGEGSSDYGLQLVSSTIGGNLENSGLIEGTSGGIRFDYVNITTGDLLNTDEGSINSSEGYGLNLYGSTIGGNLENAGLIQGSEDGLVIEGGEGNSAGIVGDLLNSGTIDGGEGVGIVLEGASIGGKLQNSNTIAGDHIGLLIESGEGTPSGIGSDLINTADGTIQGGGYGLVVASASIGRNLENAGIIDGGEGVVLDAAYITEDLLNSGSITGDFAALYAENSHIGGDLRNATGGIISGNMVGLALFSGNQLDGDLDNAGRIEGGLFGAYVAGSTIDSDLNNSGHIEGSEAGGLALFGSTLGGDLNNSGSIRLLDGSEGGMQPSAALMGAEGSIDGNLVNTADGSIDGGQGYGITLDNFRIGGNLDNAGTIEGGEDGINLSGSLVEGDIRNSGSITGGYEGITLYGSTVDGTLRNQGLISGGSFGIAAVVDTNLGHIINEAGKTIVGGEGGIIVASNATVGGLDNYGTIASNHFAIYVENREDTSSLGDINLFGNARLVGDVQAAGSDLYLKNGARFANENAIAVNSFTVEQGASLNFGAGQHIDHGDSEYPNLLDGISVTNGLHNQGTINLASGVTGTVHGNYFQAAGGKLNIGVTGDNSFGKLVVDGTASLASNAQIGVNVSPTDYRFSVDRLQNVLSAGTLQSDGTFAVTDNSLLFNFGAVKDGNTVDLTLSAALPQVETITRNLGNTPAAGAARVLDQVFADDPEGELASHFVGLQTEQQVNDAVTQTLPTIVGASNSATNSALSGINRVVQARQASNSGLSSGDAALDDQHLWLKPFGSWADQDDRNGVSGFDANTYGLAIGSDAAINERTRLGVAFAYANTNVDSDSQVAPQDMQVDTFQLIGYGSYNLAPNTELNFQLDGGRNNNDGKRHMPFADATAKADYSSTNVHAGLGIGHSLDFSDTLTFQPSARVDYTWIGEESYHETGAGALNLDVDSNDAEELILSTDGKLSVGLSEHTVLSANLGVGYDLINEQSSITSAYAGSPSAAFTTRGLDPSPWLGRAGLGLTHELSDGTEVSLRYDAESRSDFLNQGASIKARWAF
ncbi:autotransporter domain-containing protein [Pseudomonas sp. UL073]|uniref:Autotransporter domain-containing protein n=1 Tax=Zestomonas insulae TaxID=2809017 RepID=A0ABS2IK34_9GAMM|nr:autotransporter domain-containing protein [Pseudomonas insulae]MBM7063421.1 autotransporter domain-containing protein [Pseudomonas insulae]